ncbi:MAG TPA: flagellin [Limnochordia bacterium]|nr:flagellin [Limnochordia bacterium]HPZ30019.1 flagellin [Limnochordia bacterium]HQD70883.1 flagellin [Limnochordia bacterium]
MRINNNISAINAQRRLNANQKAGAKSMEKLSSGLRIARAADDAAGLAISEKMRAQIRGLRQASRNAQDGISLVQTAEGALNETHAILHRLRELAVQAATDTNTLEDRKAIQREVNELIDAIDEIANNTEFNATKILDGSFSGKIHIGANQDQNMDISITSMKSADLGIAGGQTLADLKVDNLDDDTTETGGVLTYDDANSAIGVIDGAIKQVSNERAMLGAIQNRLEHSIANLNSSAENLQASESRIRDLDMEEEFMEFVKNTILQQAATSMLAHANMAPQSVLQLLGQ